MSTTLTARIVREALALCAAILAALLIFHAVAFDGLYRWGMLRQHQAQLWQAVIQFGGADRTRDKPLAAYTAATGAPVMVFTSLLDFADRDFLHLLPTVTIDPGEGSDITLIASLLDTGGTPLELEAGEVVEFSALRIGSSQYYEPLTLTTESTTYITRVDTDWPPQQIVYNRGHVLSANQPAQGQLASLADELYRTFRSGFINNDLSSRRLDAILSSSIDSPMWGRLHFFHENREVSGVSYHFVSLRPVYFSNQERHFAGPALAGLMIITTAMIIAGALLLAWQLRRPLGRLVNVTDKLTALDFSDSPAADGPGEIGKLAENIGAMSNSLEAALAELKSASEMSAKNEERLKLLLSDLAHEFKTPLGIISSYFEVLEKGYHEGSVADYFDVLDDEINRLSDMVNEVIELSKLQTGNWRIDLGLWDLPEIIDTVMLKFAKQFESQGFAVSWSAPDVSVRVDARRIEQVFSNLISNALKYSNSSKIIQVSAVPADENQVTVYVRNSGHLSESERSRIWDRYYSTGFMTKARLPSEGIGLDIVKTILVSHGSRYGVIQEEDMVSFYFSLPIELSPELDVEE